MDDEYAKCYHTVIMPAQLEVLRSALGGEAGTNDERQRVLNVIGGFADTTFELLLCRSDWSELGTEVK
jgi:hypothetical protein